MCASWRGSCRVPGLSQCQRTRPCGAALRRKVSRSAASPSAWRSGQLAIGDIDGTTVVNGDGTNLHVLRAPRSQVTFSPDGRALTYLDRGGWIVSARPPARCARSFASAEPSGRTPLVSKRAIARLRLRHHPRADQHRNHQPHGHQPPPRRGQERKLPTSTGLPTGQWIAYTDPNSTQDLAGATRRQRQTPRHLSGTSSDGFGQPDFSWSPDGDPDCLHRAITARPDRRCAAHRRHRTPFHQRRPPPGRRPVVTKRTVTRVRSQWHPDRPPTRQRRRDPRRTRSVRRAVVTRRTLDRVPNHQEGQHRHRPGNRRGGLARRNPAPPDRDAAQTRNPRLGIIPNPVAG